ncbi:hypothetical protein [Arcticibacter eurypsychrophilus]|uniref:hypothetical protein n=1 Tax=Arcticibacter eurypsychrophilus TaxID=1434752 RepID=UPI00084D8794|nr:hypothetical protein [Arcticibacter eurypsychrophilus]
MGIFKEKVLDQLNLLSDNLHQEGKDVFEVYDRGSEVLIQLKEGVDLKVFAAKFPETISSYLPEIDAEKERIKFIIGNQLESSLYILET